MNHSFAQEVVDKNEPLPHETMPEYHGGAGEMMKFIVKNTKYPKMAKDSSWTGRAIIKFTIDSIGKIIELSIAKSSGYVILDNEAIRVVEAMPRWNPGMINSNGVPVKINIPFNFTLNNK